MKKILLTLFALLPVLTTFAQADKTSPIKTFDSYWMVGVRFGFAQFQGDVNDKSFFSKLDKASKPSFDISLGRQISPVLSFKASYSNSTYFSTDSLLWHNSVKKTNLSLSGKISEVGLYGTLNLNKLLSKNKETGNNWNAYISSGIGLANWSCILMNGDNNVKVAQVKKSVYHDYSVSTVDSVSKITTLSKLSIPLTLGVSFQVVEGIWCSLEHSMHFVNSDRVDGYVGNNNDRYSTTNFGVTVSLQKLASIRFKRNPEKSSSYSTSKVRPEKTVRRSIFRGTPKSLPEMQEYTGYNGLLPPVLPKIDSVSKTKSVGANANKNVWVAESDSGRYEITGGNRLNNEVYVGTDPQTESDPQTGIAPVYRVQIQASKTYISADAVLTKFALKEKVSVELRSDGWYRYYIGQYSSLSDARKKLSEMRTKGMKDAFIVSFKTSVRKMIK